MKRKINMMKSLFLSIASSGLINWIILITGIMGMTFDLFDVVIYKIIFVILALEVLFLNANYDNQK